MLDDAALDRFARDGYLVIPGAVPDDVVAACGRDVDAALRDAGVDPDDPATWTRPVVRLDCPLTRPFVDAARQPVLWEAYDALLGPGRWVEPAIVGGTIPVRFPHPDDPGDAGWHLDGGFAGPDGHYWIDRRSTGRGLLSLFLLTDVGDDDAPTELKVGSHHDVPAVLDAHGDAGASYLTVAEELPARTFGRPSSFATGRAGDVLVCHPFLVHRATWPHRGARPRAIAQPAVAQPEPFRLDGVDPSPVERTILAALGADASPLDGGPLTADPPGGTNGR